MDIDFLLKHIPPEQTNAALAEFLAHYLNPAFGTLPKGEVELLVLNLLERIGAIEPEPTVYQLVSALHITRSKARRLIYERELRRSSAASLDARVKALLKRPLLQKEGELFVLEVENPLLADHLRAKLQVLGYVSDGSFSPSLIKLGLDAVTALVEDSLSEDEREAIRHALVKAGAPDTSFSGVLKATLKKIAAKVADDTGEALMSKVSEYWTPIVDGAVDHVIEAAKSLFED
ncbi:hypothetical protein [Andreprevotia chitinilytica]|uniref:hypothetical protein n=1 Tax=Andreprevotia chitinilytica TaxID=396808 RepID=UPI00055206B5|nr:hypothetical protein [Andreprevotia chitinilytica]